MIGVTYSRYSEGEGQRDESIEAQQDAIRKYAMDKGYTVIREYTDKARSGREADKRAAFQQMVRDAAGGGFSFILIHKSNRFGRNKGETAYYKYKLKRMGVKVIAVAEDFGDGPHAVIMESLLEGLAEYQSLDLATETMKGLMINAKHCKTTGGRPLYGYRVNAEKEYEIEEAEAQTVTFIFEKFLCGWSYADIVRDLNSRGIRKRNGQKWARNIIYEALRNERYAGVFTFNQYGARLPNGKRNNRVKKDESEIVRIPGGMPAIVTENMWLEVQAILKVRKKGPIRRSGNYLLTGFIFCGLCGGAYVGYKTAPTYKYYACSRKKNIMDCDNVNIKWQVAEEGSVATVKNLLAGADVKDLAAIVQDYLNAESGDRRREKQLLQQEITDTEKKIANLLDFIEQGMADAGIKQRYREHVERKGQLQGQLSLMPEQERIVSPEEVTKHLAALSPEGKSAEELREIFRKVDLRIYVYPDDRIEYNCGGESKHIVQDASPTPTLCLILARLM